MTNMTTVPSDKLKEMQQAMAEQAAVIEKLKSAIGAWERAEANELQDAEAGLISTMNTPTDSKQILAEWLDKVLGAPSGWLQTSVEEDVNTTLLRDRLPKRFNTDWWKFDPLFKKPEIK